MIKPRYKCKKCKIECEVTEFPVTWFVECNVCGEYSQFVKDGMFTKKVEMYNLKLE